MFKFIKKAELVNYADDAEQLVVQTLQIKSEAAINWFTLNEMLANPHKFQAIFLASADMEFKFEIDDITLVTEEYDKLHWVNLDKKSKLRHTYTTDLLNSWQPFKCLKKTLTIYQYQP